MTFFPPSETVCRCGCGFDIRDDVRRKFDQIRAVVGKPMVVTGPARCRAQNSKIPGSAPNSRHIYGEALDISVAGWTLFEVVQLACIATHFGAFGIGVGGDKGIMHIDFRPGPGLDMWHY